MKREELLLILDKLGVVRESVKNVRNNHILIPCPLAPWTHQKGADSKPSCSIRYDNAKAPTLFNCFACKCRGKFWTLVHDYGTYSKNDELIKLGLRLLESDEPTLSVILDSISEDLTDWTYSSDRKVCRVISDNLMNVFVPAFQSEECLNYLSSRDVTIQEVIEWGLLYDKRNNRVVFPVKNRQGEYVGAVGRGIVTKNYYNYFGFDTGLTLGGLDKFQNRGKIALVEGFFDLLRLAKWANLVNYDVLCTWTANVAFPQADQLLCLDSTIHVWYDQDDPGNEGWKVAKARLSSSPYPVKRITWEPKEMDPGKMTKDDFLRICDLTF
jgi:hypothetical protein